MSSFPSYTKILNWGESYDQNAVLRTPMAGGLAKQAKRFTKVMKQYDMTVLMSDTEYTAFLTWWYTTINNGVDFSDIADPRTGSTISARIVSGQFKMQPFTVRQNYYTITFTMETLV